MKNAIQIILVVVTIASLGYGFIQGNEASRLAGQVVQANTRALEVEAELKRQEAIANEQRAVAERSAQEARIAMARAQQAVADCQKRRK